MPKDVKILINNINRETDDNLVQSISSLFEKIFVSSIHQILLSKPYKIVRKDKSNFFAYNEREWRKTFINLPFYKEKKPTGENNEEYLKLSMQAKPHLKDDKYTLKIPIEKIKFIIVKEEQEVNEIKDYWVTKICRKIART